MDSFTEITALAALAVVAVQQILKLRVVPISIANKYPVFVNIGLSIVAALVVSWQTAVNLKNWVEWVVYVATVSVVAAIVYNNTLSNSDQIKSLEGGSEEDV